MSNSEHNETNRTAPDERRLRQFERNRFFNGKMMTARDMQAEQNYHAGRLDTLAQHVTGEGIVCGLEVEIKPAEGNGDTPTAVVGPGLAFDSGGRPIVVADETHEEIPGGVLQGEGVSVFIKQTTCKMESVPIPGSEDACKEKCNYNRLREAVGITFTSGPPDQQKPVPIDHVDFPTRETLRFDETEGDEIKPTDNALQELALSYHRRLEDDPGEGQYLPCDTGSDGEVFIGYFRQQDDESWSPVEASTGDGEPRPHVYTNDMLYAGLAKHATDFGNPHEVALDLERPEREPNEPRIPEEEELNTGRDDLSQYVQGQRLTMAVSPNFDYQLHEFDEPTAQIGREVDRVDPSGSEEATLDTGNYPAGWYIITIEVGEIEAQEAAVVFEEGDAADTIDSEFRRAAFETVEPPTQSSVGAVLTVADLPTDEYDVRFTSPEDTVSIEPDTETRTVEFDIAGLQDLQNIRNQLDELMELSDEVEQLTTRLNEHEAYLRRKTLECKITSFSVVSEKFDDEQVRALAEDIITKSQAAIDSDLFEDGEQDEYRTRIEEISNREEALQQELENQATSESYERYERALSQLQEAIDSEDALSMALAQDCVSEAAEWLVE